MCFSAEASFIAAGVTGMAGVFAIARAPSRAFLPLGVIPFVFAIQQGVEGAIWIGLASDSSALALNHLSKAFLIIGEALWPMLVPLAVLAAEPIPKRRRILASLALLGAGLFAAFSLLIAVAEYTPEIQNGCIRYGGKIAWPIDTPVYPLSSGEPWRLSSLDWTVAPYALITIGSLFLSSHAAVRAFGLVSMIGLAVSLALYRETLVSVWCFFAALGSVTLVVAIEQARRKAGASSPNRTQGDRELSTNG